MTIIWPLWVFAVVAVAYAFGRRSGYLAAARAVRAEGPDIVVAVEAVGAPPQVYRVPPGRWLQLTNASGRLRVWRALTRPLPAEVAQMLEEVTR